jgi:phospholipid/cholesterol/gamma-HCH transport system substrate-binding protein
MLRRRRAIPLAALAAVVAAIAILVVSSRPGGQRVTAIFQQAYGLVSGGQVVVGGIQVGKITSVKLAPDGLPHVSMKLDRGIRVRENARADIRELSNSGQLNRYVLLDLGSGPALRDGAVIPSTQTAAPVEIDQLLSTFTPQTRADVRAVLRSFDDATTNLAPAFRASLQNSAQGFRETAGVLSEVTQDGIALRTLVDQGARVTTSLRTDRVALGTTVDQLAGLLTTTADRQPALRQAIALFPAGLRGPRQALDRLSAAVPHLRSLVQATAPAVGQLGATAEQLAPVLKRGRSTLAALVSLERQAPARLRSLGGLLPTLQSSLSRMTSVLRYSLPILDYVRVYSPDFTGLVANWSAMNSTYDAAGHVTRIWASSVAPPVTPRPASSGAPGYLTPPFVRLPGSAGGDAWTDFTSSFLAPPGDR